MALKVKSLGPTDTENLAIRIEKEVENEIVKVAKRIFKRIASNDPLFSDLETLARGYISSKMSKGLLIISLLLVVENNINDSFSYTEI